MIEPMSPAVSGSYRKPLNERISGIGVVVFMLLKDELGKEVFGSIVLHYKRLFLVSLLSSSICWNAQFRYI